jgi:hypothetical protein
MRAGKQRIHAQAFDTVFWGQIQNVSDRALGI